MQEDFGLFRVEARKDGYKLLESLLVSLVLLDSSLSLKISHPDSLKEAFTLCFLTLKHVLADVVFVVELSNLVFRIEL